MAIKRSASVGSVIDLTNSDDGDNDNDFDNDDLDGIRYPGIPGMLAELEREYPNLHFMQYEEILIGNGFMYVGQLVEEEVRRQLEGLGIRIGEINLLLSRAKRIVRRTQKLKQED